MTGFRVILDACVLVPINKADLLLTFAEHHAYSPHWSERILEETVYAIPIATRRAVSLDRARKRIRMMNDAFEDALIEGWEPLEAGIQGLPDPKDRHVVAAAVRGSAAAIVTDNLDDFPAEVLEPLGLHARSSDQFLLDLMSLNEARAVACVAQTADKRRNPAVSTEEYLAALARADAPKFAREIAPLFEIGS